LTCWGRGLLLAVIGMGLGIALIGCGGSPGGSGPSPALLKDCRIHPGVGSTGQGSVQYGVITVDGRLREYRLFQPPALNKTMPAPLVIALHGTPMNADDFATSTHLDTEAATAGFLVAYPNGCNSSWEYPEGGPKAAQINFISTLITQVEARFRIDKNRIFLVGFSAGTVMSYRLACDLSGQVAAVAAVADAMRPDDCSPSRPVSILQMHGTDDCWVGGCPFPYLLGADAVNQRWRTIDGCTGDPTVSQSGITKTSQWRCKDGVTVRLDAITGGHHTWFGCHFCDPVPGEPDANSVIWSFFSGLQTTG
jgi:polyhydroxybutyrate depolymerase